MGNVGNDNRHFIMEKRYALRDSDAMFNLDQEVMELTKRNARLSIIVGQKSVLLQAFCRTKKSRVYKLCEQFGFELF